MSNLDLLATDLNDALDLLLKDSGPEGKKRVLRVVARIEADAFQRGYQSRQQEILSNLRDIRDAWDRG